jgi:hypothetical protein
MTQRVDLACGIYMALLTRDPLPAQRFTEMSVRIEQLARISFVAADTFLAISEEAAQVAGQQFHAKAALSWDARSTAPADVPTPSKLKNSVEADIQAARAEIPAPERDFFGLA